jgi:hypothetical protein
MAATKKPTKPTRIARASTSASSAKSTRGASKVGSNAGSARVAKSANSVDSGAAPGLRAAKTAGDATVLSARALNRATLARQMLLRREKVSPVVALERLLGLQAQMPRPPFVALWARLAGFRRQDLVSPIASREIVRATMMRATIHLFTRRDFVAFRPVIQPVLTGAWQGVLKDRVKAIDVDRLLAVSRACFESNPCTLEELRRQLVAGPFPKLDERAMGYIVKMQLPLVQTPEEGAAWAYPAAANFAVAESWLDEPLNLGPLVVSGDAATMSAPSPQALALRYFAAFGPASVQDFQSWAGFKSMRAVVEELRPQLQTFRDEHGRELFDLPKAPRPAADAEAPVRFLGEFDNVLLGYADRDRIVSAAHRPALLTKNLLVPATFLIDGFIAGMWSIETKKGIARLLLKPFITLGKSTRTALDEEGEQLLRFVEPDAKSYEVVLP